MHVKTLTAMITGPDLDKGLTIEWCWLCCCQHVKRVPKKPAGAQEGR